MPERQYPFEAHLEYKTIHRRKVLETGRGITVYISTKEIVFKAARPLPAGLEIEVYIDWPARLDNVIALRLYAHGETQEMRNDCVVVKILRCDFRIAPKSHSS